MLFVRSAPARLPRGTCSPSCVTGLATKVAPTALADSITSFWILAVISAIGSVGRQLAQLCRKLNAVLAGHVEVEQRHVDAAACRAARAPRRRCPASTRSQSGCRAADRLSGHDAGQLAVVHDQDRRCHSMLRRCSWVWGCSLASSLAPARVCRTGINHVLTKLSRGDPSTAGLKASNVCKMAACRWSDF